MFVILSISKCQLQEKYFTRSKLGLADVVYASATASTEYNYSVSIYLYSVLTGTLKCFLIEIALRHEQLEER